MQTSNLTAEEQKAYRALANAARRVQELAQKRESENKRKSRLKSASGDTFASRDAGQET